MKEHYFTVKVTVHGNDPSTAHFELVSEGMPNPDRPVWNDESGNWEKSDGANAGVDSAIMLSLREAMVRANLSV